jgi:hypothetical protein
VGRNRKVEQVSTADSQPKGWLSGFGRKIKTKTKIRTIKKETHAPGGLT